MFFIPKQTVVIFTNKTKEQIVMKTRELLEKYICYLESSSNKSKETISAYKYDVSAFITLSSQIMFFYQSRKNVCLAVCLF